MRASYGRNSREDVIDVALEVLDEAGLPDLTMRRLASALDVQPSALYWHFTDKQTLLASVSDRIVARVSAPHPQDGSSWADGTLAEAKALRDALLTYRDGAELVASSLALGLGGDMARERLRAALVRGGFDADTVNAAADALLHLLLGYVAQEQQRLQADSLGVVHSAHSARVEIVDGAAPSPGAAFEFGVTLLLDGLAQHVDGHSRGDRLRCDDASSSSDLR